MDIQMPVMDGYAATEKIREFESESSDRSQAFVVAVSADTLPESRSKAISSGCNDYMYKPIQVDSFFKKLKTWLKP